MLSLVSCTIKALVSCTSSVRCNSGSRLGGRFLVSVTAHVLCISSCLVLSRLSSTSSTSTCTNIREIMLITIISSASWTLHLLLRLCWKWWCRDYIYNLYFADFQVTCKWLSLTLKIHINQAKRWVLLCEFFICFCFCLQYF